MTKDMKTILTRLFTVIMLMMTSMAVGAKVDVELNKEYKGGKVEVKPQVDNPDGSTLVTITVTPDQGFTITHSDKNKGIIVVAVRPTGSQSGTRAPQIAGDLDVKGPTETVSYPNSVDYQFTVPAGLNAWVQDIKFQDSGRKEGDEPILKPVGHDYSGTYYMGNEGETNNNGDVQYNPETPETNYFMCPCSSADEYSSGQPFLTTYQHFGNGNDANPVTALWTIIFAGTDADDGKDYYRFYNVNSGQYMVANGFVLSNQKHRKRVHMETLANPTTNANTLFNITAIGSNGGVLITSKTEKEGSNIYLNPSSGNRNSLISMNGTSATTTPSSFFTGTLGFYSGNTGGSIWYPIDAVKAPNIFLSDNTVSITYPDAGETGLTFYYTTDGSEPDLDHVGGDNPTQQYTTAITLDYDATEIKAVSVKSFTGTSSNSFSVKSAVTDFPLTQLDTPTITFDNTTGNAIITSATTGATIFYTTAAGESEPATPTTSTLTSGTTPVSIPLTVQTTIKAFAAKPGWKASEVAGPTTINKVKTPNRDTTDDGKVMLTCSTPDVSIYYNIGDDASVADPTISSSTPYNEPIDDVSGKYIKAIAVKEGWITSEIYSSGAITLQCATPVISRAAKQAFKITCGFPAGAQIYYVTDNSVTDEAFIASPSTAGTSYTANAEISFAPDDAVTVRAIAVLAGYDNSNMATKTLTKDLEGGGTAGNPYLINSGPDFEMFVEKANTVEGASLYYKLCTDVSASGISAITTDFSGSFDGDSYVITGLTHPLFNTVDGGTVKNVTLKSVNINSSDANVGAIAGVAKGYSRIYNCGILPNSADFPDGTESHPSVTTSGACAGGLVGSLEDDSRVINCYSYADVSAATYAAGIVGYNNFASTAAVTNGKYAELRTAIVNCMFYGDILGGINQYGVYGGQLITNASATGISSYNYFRSGSKFNAANGHKNTSSGANVVGNPTAYNCSFPAEERYLTQVEFHRSLLNSNRELCGWWVGSDVAPSTMSTVDVQAIPKDASIIYKWVVDPSLAPYPILKPFGKYASVINGNTGTPWVNRATANPREGKQLGTLKVNVKSGDHSTASDKTLYLPITDMDKLHYDYSYYKVQLPYFNTVFGDPDGATWAEKYAGNYTNWVVTGWKVTAVDKEGKNNFLAAWEDGYNFADRDCTDKDLYDTSSRVFAQGGYYYVPDGVSEITIEAYWGTAIYVCDDGYSYDRVNITEGNTGTHFAPAGKRNDNSNIIVPDVTIYTTKIRDVIDNITTKKTVYDYAIVLVGNVQESNGNNAVTVSSGNTYGFTIMSADFDFDDEPDYCLEWQLGTGMTRNTIAPIRFDFLPVVELGIAGKLHNSTNFFAFGCFRSYGHFEVTETAFIHFGQFEFELQTRDNGPIILNGGIFDQYTRGRNNETNQHITYVIVGGHLVMPSFTPGAHVGAKYQTRHCAVNALGGDFTSFYLTGGYREDVDPFDDNPHCYIDGGHFGTIAAAYKEGIKGNVTWRINHALIDEFYGGGMMSDDNKIVKGNIDVVIDNSIVGKYCGGPKFGNMVSGKTVTTSATNTTFTEYYGAGNGGTNYVQYANDDKTDGPRTASQWLSLLTSSGNGKYSPRKYINTAKSYHANYDYEEINPSTGTTTSGSVDRIYYYSAQFATTNTGTITNTLDGCTIEQSFYGGGFLGGVNGNVTSTLTGCTVLGSVFGAGYSASAGTVTIYNTDKTPPVANVYTGIVKPQEGGTSTEYYWTHDSGSTGSPVTAAQNSEDHDYFFTEVELDKLGAVSGDVTLTLDDTTVTGSVYGGGFASKVTGSNHTVTVNLQGETTVNGSVFGGGNKGEVEGSTIVNIKDGDD